MPLPEVIEIVPLTKPVQAEITVPGSKSITNRALVLATLVFALVTKMPDADFASYGWRIPFLISIVLLGVGTFVRSRVPETPVFEGLKLRDGLSKNPVGEAVVWYVQQGANIYYIRCFVPGGGV